MNKQNYSQPTKETLPTQTTTEEKKIRTIQRTRNILTYLVAIFCVASFFSFEFVSNFSDRYLIAQKDYKKEIKNVQSALDKVKKEAENTTAFSEYLEARKLKDKVKKSYYEIKKEESFLGFKSFQLFLGEFGYWLSFLIYGLFMLYRSFIKDKTNFGMKFLHAVVLSGPIFYMFWIFQPFQDVSKASYYFATVISTLAIIFAIYLITKYRKDRIDYLQDNLMEVAKFTFKNTKPEKREEMLDMIKKIATNK